MPPCEAAFAPRGAPVATTDGACAHPAGRTPRRRCCSRRPFSARVACVHARGGAGPPRASPTPPPPRVPPLQPARRGDRPQRAAPRPAGGGRDSSTLFDLLVVRTSKAQNEAPLHTRARRADRASTNACTRHARYPASAAPVALPWERLPHVPPLLPSHSLEPLFHSLVHAD